MKSAIAAGLLLIAMFTLYAVTYYSQLVSPEPVYRFKSGEMYKHKRVEYRLPYKPVEVILAPMHHIDRQLRPEVWNRETLPSEFYLTDDVQYFAPGPEFKLANEAAAMKAAEEQ